jgi:hypothetical protein
MSFKGMHIVILSVIFGILVWFSVDISEEYQVTVQAPLKIVQIPEGKAIKSAIPPTLSLKLYGKGWQMATTLWTSNLSLSFPAQMFANGKKAITFTDVADKLSSEIGVRLVDMAPESVYVQLDREVRKTVPINLDMQVLYRDGYGEVGPTSMTPDSVTLSGAEEVLKGVYSWNTVHGYFDDVRAPLQADLALESPAPYIIQLSVSRVHISMDVEPFAEKTISGLLVETKSVAPNRELIIIPPKIDIVVRGGIRQLSTVTGNDFHVSVNYRNVIADSSGVVDADIDAPPGIQVVARKPERLQYVVRRPL